MIRLIINIVQDKPDFASVNVVTVENDATDIERMAAENLKDVIDNELQEEESE